MPIAEFCEREYETIFNRQITTLHEYVWTPGQVQEHILGFDAAFLSNSQLIFDLFPAWRFLPIGIRPSSDNWQEFFDIADRHFPPFCFNLFVQHKRPEFIGSRRGKERSYWKRPYFRYDIDSNQQACLEKLETVSGNDALVTYACAAFHKHQELWEHVTPIHRDPVIQLRPSSRLERSSSVFVRRSGEYGSGHLRTGDSREPGIPRTVPRASRC